jgi:signal transduction histidine kinase
MSIFELVWQGPGAEAIRASVPEKGLLIGRSEDCDIALPHDPAVSRHHARVYPKGDYLVVEDLGSRNGIYLGKERHVLCHLSGGAEFRIGEQHMRVTRKDDSSIKHAVISAAVSTTIEEQILRATPDSSLRVLYQAARLLGEMFEPDALSSAILKLIFEALPVRRGYIFTLEGEPAEPVVRASLSKSPQDMGPPLSRTLIDQVFKTRESVLIHDAQHDSRFDQSASIVGHQIHSAMCAPLMGRTEPVGALYVDSGTDVHPFERADLELLTAVARIVGIAVENAQLHEQRMQQERLAAIGEATAGLGHCIKNIMTGVRGSSEIISIAVERQEYRGLNTAWPILLRCVERIDTLVMNMLSYSRRYELEPMLTDLGSLAREAVAMLRSQAEAKGIAVDYIYDGSAVINLDGREMLRVITNLLMNAIDACEKDRGEIVLDIHPDDEGLTLSIKDNGAGIPEDVLPRIFDAFYTTKGSRGTGLGLACCDKIVAQHGGRIDVESTPGEGSTFLVYLPYERKSGKATQRISIIRRAASQENVATQI